MNWTMHFVNRSNSTQDWQIYSPGINHSFTLLPNHAVDATVTLNNDRVFQIAVSTDGGFAAATLTYTAATASFALSSNTPNEFQLAQGGGTVSVRCLLENVITEDEIDFVSHQPRRAVPESAA